MDASRVVIDLAEPQRGYVQHAATPRVPSPVVWHQVRENGNSRGTAAVRVYTPNSLHQVRSAASPTPFTVARRAVAHVTGCASPAPPLPTPLTVLQSPRRLSAAEQLVASPRKVPGRFQQVPRVAPPREEPPPARPRPAHAGPGAGAGAAPPRPPSAPSDGSLVPGTELQVGYMKLKCEELLGSGSYSTVWLATVVSQRDSPKPVKEGTTVALKDVFCRGEAALQQSLFEVQLLMAVERRVARAAQQGQATAPRLPRCLTYQVDATEEGWSVRMALTRLKGEQLDAWLQRSCELSKWRLQRLLEGHPRTVTPQFANSFDKWEVFIKTLPQGLCDHLQGVRVRKREQPEEEDEETNAALNTPSQLRSTVTCLRIFSLYKPSFERDDGDDGDEMDGDPDGKIDLGPGSRPWASSHVVFRLKQLPLGR
ncbi:unnamed protein product [Effrenium voratum]|nr:unnamed protein product [Effrenium voratum]